MVERGKRKRCRAAWEEKNHEQQGCGVRRGIPPKRYCCTPHGWTIPLFIFLLPFYYSGYPFLFFIGTHKNGRGHHEGDGTRCKRSVRQSPTRFLFFCTKGGRITARGEQHPVATRCGPRRLVSFLNSPWETRRKRKLRRYIPRCLHARLMRTWPGSPCARGCVVVGSEEGKNGG
jgi:hypothetical protein